MSDCDWVDDFDDVELESWETSASSKALIQKFESKVNFGMKQKDQIRDKSDRATTEHALDRRSCTILYKLISQGAFSEVNGCLSTGELMLKIVVD